MKQILYRWRVSALIAALLAAAQLNAAEPAAASPEAGVDQQPPSVTATEAERRRAITHRYLMDRQYRDANSHAQSAVGQQAANRGAAYGHQLSQQQGGVEVGALVSGSTTGQHAGSGNLQFAPQSNSLTLHGDNYGGIQLSNINANGRQYPYRR